MYRQRGSITIFALLSMLLVMCTLFSLLEITRYQAIKGLANLQTETVLESAFANFSSILWEQYHLLACEETQVKEAIDSAGETRLEDSSNRYNFLLFRNKEAELTGYRRLTDEKGKAYVQTVSSYMERNLLYETAKQIYNQYEALEHLKENSKLDLETVDRALEEIEKEKERQQEEKPVSVSTGTSKQRKETIENPLEEYQKLQKTGILELVLEDTEHLSKAEFSLENVVSNRILKEGTKNMYSEDTDWLDRVWMQQYLLTYFSFYGQAQEGHHLAYELEYLLGGKGSDLENLKIVVTEILALRTLCNFLYLTSDVEKQEEANLVAFILTRGNAALIEVVKLGLLTAWAFGESVLDVRALFQDKKIPLIKSRDLWTLELSNIGVVSQVDYSAKEGEFGLSYGNYLGLLLLFSSDEELAMRSMDVQEATIQMESGDSTFHMDELLVQAEVEMTYEYQPIFFHIEDINLAGAWKYEIYTQKKYAYGGR